MHQEQTFENMFYELKSNNECFLDELFDTPLLEK